MKALNLLSRLTQIKSQKGDGLTGVIFLGPPPLRGSFFLKNGTLRETREKKIFPIGSKNVTQNLSPLFILVNQTPNLIFLGAKN